MTPGTDGEGAVRQRLHGFWEYYRRYTQTAVHAASAAALTAFGLLVFVDRLFVVLAITAYVFPPLFLYYFGADASLDAEQTGERGHRVEDRGTSTGGTHPRAHDEIGADADASDDTSAGGRDGDTDGRDVDIDGRDGDTDGRDGDADGRDADTGGRDADADSRDADADDG